MKNRTMKKLTKILLMTCIISLVGLAKPIFSQCESGGRGASECSYTFSSPRFFGLWTVETTHSVSCGEDMYACCTKNGAGCVFNRPTFVQA